MAEETAYRMGKKLGADTREATPAEKQAAKEGLAWSRAQADNRPPAEEDYRVAVEKG